MFLITDTITYLLTNSTTWLHSELYIFTNDSAQLGFHSVKWFPQCGHPYKPKVDNADVSHCTKLRGVTTQKTILKVTNVSTTDVIHYVMQTSVYMQTKSTVKPYNHVEEPQHVLEKEVSTHLLARPQRKILTCPFDPSTRNLITP